MKGGLPIIPNLQDLENAYSMLLHGHPTIPTAKLLAQWSQWSRFDPRLAEIWIDYLTGQWTKINPIELREGIFQQPWPGIVGPLLEFAGKLVQIKTSRDSNKLFHYWTKIITDGLPKGAWEQFFIGLRQLGGQAMQEDAHLSLAEYRKWGYLGREILVNKKYLLTPHLEKTKLQACSLDTVRRIEILKSLLVSSDRIDTTTYWNALGQCISKRQAERDLRNNPLLKALGRTRGRYFVKTSGASKR